MAVHKHLRPSPGHSGTPPSGADAHAAPNQGTATGDTILAFEIAYRHKKPAFVKIGPGIGLGYRRNQTVGTWIVRVADGKGANATKAFAIADDAEDADGKTVLTYWQAQDRAREISRANDSSDEPPREPITIFHALEAYGADLKTRGGDIGNVARVRGHLPEGLGNKPVALLTSRDLRSWRDALVSHLAAASVNRTCAAFKAALNLAADHDEAIGNRRAWETGLGSIPDAEAGADPDIACQPSCCYRSSGDQPAARKANRCSLEKIRSFPAVRARRETHRAEPERGHDLCPAAFEHCSPAARRCASAHRGCEPRHERDDAGANVFSSYRRSLRCTRPGRVARHCAGAAAG